MPLGPDKSKAIAAMARGKSAPGGKAGGEGGEDDKKLDLAERHMRAMYKAMQAGDFRAAAKAALYMKDV